MTYFGEIFLVAQLSTFQQYWHLADIRAATVDVRCPGQCGPKVRLSQRRAAAVHSALRRFSGTTVFSLEAAQ